MSKKAGISAAREILLAASELADQGRSEFSEWDLTVAVWNRDKNKFGCRGYEDVYPDHKRVMMEIMAPKKTDNPIRRGWIERTRANHYRLTPLGRAEADRLGRVTNDTKTTHASGSNIYDAVVRYANHRVFRAYCKDSNEPSTWLGAEAFFGLTKQDASHVATRIGIAENAVADALRWSDETDQDAIRRGAAGGGITIRRQDLIKLQEFIGVLQDRFAVQLSAMRKTRR